MCGRYTLVKLLDLGVVFPWITSPPAAEPRYNIAPTQPVLAVANDQPDQYDYFLWGLIPSWAKDPTIGNRMINARAETLAEKPAFRTALQRRRCLIPADGFYEWRKEADGKTRTPMYVRMKSQLPFAFAGLWDTWHAPDGSTVRSCTIITTQPNPLMQPIHDRMPAIVPAEGYQRWLSREAADPRQLQDLLAPYPAEQMQATPVSRTVNNPKNESPQCIEPLA